MTACLDMFSLEGRVAIVTGASRGIGNAIARGLSLAGAEVFGIGRSTTLQVKTDTFSYSSCDITSHNDFGNLAKNIYDKKGHIDILVNSAGITLPSLAKTSPGEAFTKTLEFNLAAVFECCQTIKPFMTSGEYGSIVNVTSVAGSLGFPANPGYVASKGGLAALSRALAVDYATEGIRVNNLVPGYVRTGMTENSYVDLEKREVRTKRTILGRWGNANDLVGAAIFLASAASSYVTGTDLYVDGGWSVKGL